MHKNALPSTPRATQLLCASSQLEETHKSIGDWEGAAGAAMALPLQEAHRSLSRPQYKDAGSSLHIGSTAYHRPWSPSHLELGVCSVCPFHWNKHLGEGLSSITDKVFRALVSSSSSKVTLPSCPKTPVFPFMSQSDSKTQQASEQTAAQHDQRGWFVLDSPGITQKAKYPSKPFILERSGS